MNMKKTVSFPFRHFLFCVLFLFLMSSSVYASSLPVSIVNCRFISKKTLQVTASLTEPAKVSGDTCYLFSVDPSSEKIASGAKPLAHTGKASQMTFKVSVTSKNKNSLMYDQFVVASKSGNGYSVISNRRYATNSSSLAKYSYAFPKASSKKGLQANNELWEDASELNIQHSVLNINLNDFISSKSEYNTGVSYKYKYNGKTYWFRKGVIGSYDDQLEQINAVNTSAILLLGWRDDLTYLIPKNARTPGHYYYAWNMSSAKSRNMLEAAISFLANRYSTSKAKHGRIVNWIVGNEVNNLNTWNYCGKVSLSTYAKTYADAVRLTYTAVTAVYANARVYISLDHLWNMTQSGSFTGRAMLEAFASAISRYGYIPWNIAYHAYASPLTEPKFWENQNKMLKMALTTPVINMGNLSILTNYVKKNYGSNTRIILSEQGYTSLKNGKNVENEQSAAIVYSYYISESNDMVDSFILHRHIDHQVEEDQGLSLGLWNSKGTETATTKKSSWSVFKYMDTTLSEQYTSSALSVIGAKSWSELIEGFSKELYSKIDYSQGSLKPTGKYAKKASVSGKWKAYGAVSGKKKVKGGLTVYHNGSRNANALWGVSQKFSGGLSFEKYPVLHTTLKITGAKNKKATVKIRFFSGNAVLECTRVVTSGKTCRLAADLSRWKYKNKVTRIQILAGPSGAKGWTGDAMMTIQNTVRGN